MTHALPMQQAGPNMRSTIEYTVKKINRISVLVVFLNLVAGCVTEAGDLSDESDLGSQELGLVRQNFISNERELSELENALGRCQEQDPDSERELLIRDLSVVQDSVRTTWRDNGASGDGVWHFGRLMKNMAGNQDPSVFVKNWLAFFTKRQKVNGFNVDARKGMTDWVNQAWPKVNGKLDLKNAPLKLVAIVNRMDLRKLSEGNAGEGRFVFAPVDPNGFPMKATIILEYKLPASTPEDVLRWARDFHTLGNWPIESERYRSALQAITDRFAGANAAPGRPNGSSISQIRTNEALNASIGGWELREFRLTNVGKLAMVPVFNNPPETLMTSPVLANFINQNEAAILLQQHIVPLKFENKNLAGGASLNQQSPWNIPGVNNPEARHKFALNTCSGCHGSETKTNGFVHIDVRDFSEPASLSGFMTGISVDDPVNGNRRMFGELKRRSLDMKSLLCSNGTNAVVEIETQRVH